MSDPRDYPAAHSMDTTWFAVDRDGHVAVFESGEPGAVPVEAMDGSQGYDVLEKLEGLQATGDAVLLPPVPVWPEADEHEVNPDYTKIAVFHLRSAAAVADELARGTARRVAGEGGEAVRVEGVTPELFARLHASGECLGCQASMDQYRDEDDRPSPAARGLYEYSHPCDIAGPYRLEVKPSRPIRLEDVPPEAREHMVRFDGRFEETRLIQPLAIWPCESWGAAWLDVDRRTVRPVAGMEEAYPEELEWLRKIPGLKLDPPPAAPATAPEPARAAPAAEPPPSAGIAAPRKPWWKVW